MLSFADYSEGYFWDWYNLLGFHNRAVTIYIKPLHGSIFCTLVLTWLFFSFFFLAFAFSCLYHSMSWERPDLLSSRSLFFNGACAYANSEPRDAHVKCLLDSSLQKRLSQRRVTRSQIVRAFFWYTICILDMPLLFPWRMPWRKRYVRVVTRTG